MNDLPSEWFPIADYEVDPIGLEDKELRALSSVWIEQVSSLPAIDKFTERLQREWAIETGLIERLYTLDRGITELLIEQGVKAALIPHGATKDPEQAVAMISDQQQAIEGIFAFVKGERVLTSSYIKELHSLFCRNQAYAEGRDQFGRRTQVELLKGAYKIHPNNPARPDGGVHFYCPPEHVAAEMDRLIELHNAHGDVAPEVEAAWLHHRFVQIHPFQDGNGRVARALSTLVFIRPRWLPLVVRDRERDEYIRALEQADMGELKALVDFFARLQRQEFVKALGIARELERAVKVDVRIKAIGERMARRSQALAAEHREAIDSAKKLHALARVRFDAVCASLQEVVTPHAKSKFYAEDEDDQGGRSHYHLRQIVSTAKELNYFANTQQYRSWVRFVALDSDQSNILLSFHGIGHEVRGVIVCSATWFRRVKTDEGENETEGERPLCDQVFQINYKEDYQDVEARFELWLEDVIEKGLALWEATAL